MLAVRRIARQRERAIFVARMLLHDDPKHRHDLHGAYLAAFTQQGRSERELSAWVAEVERRLGRHPCGELLPGR